ncbi:CD99 molecule isoform X1 [Embiotoca jacksoni]|uniref:CD99 molecule isoform X1 n=1 Tax=Embiotoca jacksoni TaxID=100190 RepID=UPI003704ADDC
MQLFPANMRLGVTVVLLLFVTGTLSQEFDLGDAIGDPLPTPAKPKELPKTPDNPQPDGGLSFDLGDAVDEGKPKTQTEKPKKPSSGDSGDSFGFDLEDALKPDPNPKPDKPAVNPPREGGGGGGGGTFDDSDLVNVGAGDYKPDGGNSGGNGGDPGYDPHGGADQPQAGGGSGPIAGIVSAVGVALLGAASSYFAYQKKKLCFKLQGGADPESGKGHHGTHSEPQVLSNLLRTN